jgi:predicted O-methyltransferase YrrM
MNTRLIFFRVSRYMKYIFAAENRKGHGIHSPFVFDLVNRIFRNRTDPAVVYSIEKIRKRQLSDKRVIDVKDFGAGAENKPDNFKKVSDIAVHSTVPEKYGMLLANMAAEFGRPMIIEFGTSLGISTMYMASSCSEVPVFTMEGCPATAELADLNFKEAGLKNIVLKVGSFVDTIPEIISQGIKPGLVFIDGDHRKKPLLDYFEKMAEISDNNTVIIIDDINYSGEMEEAWNEIQLYEKVSLTVDIFRMGIVFFRKGIERKNYIIRY